MGDLIEGDTPLSLRWPRHVIGRGVIMHVGQLRGRWLRVFVVSAVGWGVGR